MILFMLAAPLTLLAQPKNFMYSSGRIYVVVAVLLTIFIGIIYYLVRIDRKVDKLRKREQANH